MSLANFITPELITLQVSAQHWEEAVRAGGNLLFNEGLCESRYIDAMVKAIHDLGPYMVLAPGIALAHARPEDGMCKTGMSFINLAEPVNFGNEENDPVDIVISFGGVDNNSHLEMLRNLAEFLMIEQHQTFLKATTSKQNLLDFINTEKEVL